jgi:rod shape-determining protein MreC
MAFRDGPLHDLKVPLTWAAVGATLLAILAALVLLIADRRDVVAMTGYAPLRNAFDRVEAPVGETLEAPIRWGGSAVETVRGYFFAVAENRRLKAELRALEGWRDQAIALRDVNDRYEALLKLKTEPAVPMITARAVMDSRGPFSDARILDAGSEAGVRVGQPVISDHGAIGRIVGVAHGASRLLLLTDVESRTPVLVDRTNARAILTGDGGPNPKLEYIRGRDPVKVGDMILTSGDGGVFPRGLPVGVAAMDLKGAWRVKLYSDQTAIDYVRILVYRDIASATDPATLANSGAAPPLTAAEEAERTAALQRAVTPPPTPGSATKAATAQHVSSGPVGASPPAVAPKPTTVVRSPPELAPGAAKHAKPKPPPKKHVLPPIGGSKLEDLSLYGASGGSAPAAPPSPP